MKNIETTFITNRAFTDGRRREVTEEIENVVTFKFEAGSTGELTWEMERENGITEDIEVFPFTYFPRTAPRGATFEVYFDEDADLSTLFELPEFTSWLASTGLVIADHWSFDFEGGTQLTW